MNDLISRQAAIDAMLGDKVEITNVIRALGNERDFEVLNCTCDRHAEIIKALPTVQPKGTKLSTVCLLCKKPAVTFNTEDDIPYTNYSYCEDCLRKGLKLLKAQNKMLPPVQPDEKLEKCRFEYINACQIVTYPTPDTTKKDISDAYAVIKALQPIFGDVPFAKVKRGEADGTD